MPVVVPGLRLSTVPNMGMEKKRTALNREVADAARLIARSHGKLRVGVVGLTKDVVAFAPYVRRGHS